MLSELLYTTPALSPLSHDVHLRATPHRLHRFLRERALEHTHRVDRAHFVLGRRTIATPTRASPVVRTRRETWAKTLRLSKSTPYIYFPLTGETHDVHRHLAGWSNH